MKRRVVGGLAAGGVISVVVFGGWLLSLPGDPPRVTPPEISPREAEALLAALRPPKRERPLIAIVGINDATEITDYLMPAGILRQADVADVVMLAAGPGAVTLYPAALRVEPDATLAEFDARYPEGADTVIVPAMSRDDDPAVLQWLQTQAATRATIIGVCVGAKVVAAAGLLDGRRATSHWYVVDDLIERYPNIQYVADRRIVADRGVVTTTGITASMPIALMLIEAIAGSEKAHAVAQELGVPQWDARHASAAFQFTRSFALTAIRNRAALWDHEQLGLELTAGVDEVALALTLDAWSRTFRSRAVTFARTDRSFESRHGFRLLPHRVTESWDPEQQLTAIGNQKPAEALDAALHEIAARYGARTRDFVSMQLEYPRRTVEPEKEKSNMIETQIRKRVEDYAAAIGAKDIDRVMSFFAPDMVSFDLEPPLRYSGADNKRRRWLEGFAAHSKIEYEVRELDITAQGELAFVHALNHFKGTRVAGGMTDTWVRWTACFRRINDVWLIVHDHVSVPADLKHGSAALHLTP